MGNLKSMCIGDGSDEFKTIELESGHFDGTEFEVPTRGYFEITNTTKGDDICAIKVMHNCKQAWTIDPAHGFPSCQSMTVLRPGQTLHGRFFDSEAELQVAVAYGRRVGEEGARHRAAAALCRSELAAQPLAADPDLLTWDREALYRVESQGKNALLEYKGQGTIDIAQGKLLQKMLSWNKKGTTPRSGISLETNSEVIHRVSQAL